MHISFRTKNISRANSKSFGQIQISFSYKHNGRDGFGPGPAQPKSARAYIPTWPKVGPGPKVAQRTLAQIGLGPNFFGPGPVHENVGPDKLS